MSALKLFQTLALLLLVAGPASAVELLSTTTPESLAVWLGGPQQPYRAGNIIQIAVPMVAGQVALVTAEAEGSIYNYPDMTLLPYPMFQTSAVLVFQPGVTPPWITPLSSFPPADSVLIAPGIGMDISQATNYYSPISRSAAFRATDTGTYTFALYMWGGSGSPEVGTGNAAMVYPGTPSISVVVMP